MTNHPEAKPLPGPLKAAGTVFILLHFLALGAHALNARSGYWWSPFGRSEAEPPPFAYAIDNTLFPYLESLRMTHDYHFATNRVSVPDVKFQIKLYDKHNKVIDTLDFPENAPNPWVRHRLEIMAQQLGDDMPVSPRLGESIGKVMINVWEPDGDANVIKQIRPHEISKDRPVFAPSPRSILIARAYVRYQCRLHGASSGELVRRSRDPVEPSILVLPQMPREAFQEMVASFGQMPPPRKVTP